MGGDTGLLLEGCADERATSDGKGSMSFDWYHRYPRDFLQETAAMSLEDCGAYATIIDLIFLFDSPVADNDAVIAGYLRCHVNKWRPIRQRLIESGHLVSVNGNLDVPSVNEEIAWRRSQHNRLRQVGHRGGITSGEARRNRRLTKHMLQPEESREEEIRGEGLQRGSYLWGKDDDET
jgi:uncharacterized protein YdaU (DUF1376 family)